MLIIFALTQDKLNLDIDRSTFSLIIGVLNDVGHRALESNSNQKNQFEDDEESRDSYLNDLTSKKQGSPSQTQTSPNKIFFSSATSSLANSPNSTNKEAAAATLTSENFDVDENDELVLKKIYAKCRKIYDKLNKSFADSYYSGPLEVTFNSRLLALDCLVNLNISNKKNLLANDHFRTELRESRVIDKLVHRLGLLLGQLVKLDADESESVNCYLLGKFKNCINFLETLAQSNSSTGGGAGASKKKAASFEGVRLLSISDKSHEETNSLNVKLAVPVYTLNQNYLVELGNKKSLLIELFKK